MEHDYHGLIVKKPWGYEYLVHDNGEVALWMLHIARRRETSMHCHPRKETSLILISGRLTCRGLEWSEELEPLDILEIDKGVFHCSAATSDSPIYPTSENGAWLIEVETPVDKRDLVRANDPYGRTGKSYEGSENMVSYDQERLAIPRRHAGFSQTLFGTTFSTITGPDLAIALDRCLHGEARAYCLISQGDRHSDNLRLGGLYKGDEILRLVGRGEELSGMVFLEIRKEKNVMKLSDYVASFVADLGVREVFSVSGGGAMHLVDSFGGHEKLAYIATHHEQSAAMAAEGYARIRNSIGVGLFTTGPGGTNALTGVAGAWIDSIPTLFISGQVTSHTLIGSSGLRQYGIQESDITELVKSITKYSVTVTDENRIRYELEKAVHIATSGRPGPVWVDIPLDIQSKEISPATQEPFRPPEKEAGKLPTDYLKLQAEACLRMLAGARRPVIISGYGIRLARAEEAYRQLVERLRIPVVSSWTSSDLLPTDHDCYVGRSGIFGDRASNFAVQNADLLLIIGSRMSIPQVGYNYRTFAREAKIVMIDIDPVEMKKPSLHVDLPIQADAGDFIRQLLELERRIEPAPELEAWRDRCRDWKRRYPVVLPEYRGQPGGVNSFYFIDRLSAALDEHAVVVTDMGTSFTCTMQTFRTRAGQRLTTSSGHASMGFGLPGAIGACFANDRRQTICISGEGGLQMNIQELQTMVHHRLPIILFVLNNGGYLTIKTMQQNHFGRYVGSEPGSGVSFPDMLRVAEAYGIPARRIGDHASLERELPEVLSQPGPYICEIMMPEDQPLIPRSSSMKRPDGSIISKPLEDLYPFLDREEFLTNMIVAPVEVL